MDFNEHNENEDEQVIPDAGIIKQSNGEFSLIRFMLEDNELAAYTAEISQDELADFDDIQQIDEFSILFVKIHYEFHYDDDNGVMEMQLSRLITLSDSELEIPVTAQEVLENSPESLIPIYLDVVRSI